MRVSSELLGLLVRITGTFGANYWDFWCELLGLLVRTLIVDNLARQYDARTVFVATRA